MLQTGSIAQTAANPMLHPPQPRLEPQTSPIPATSPLPATPPPRAKIPIAKSPQPEIIATKKKMAANPDKLDFDASENEAVLDQMLGGTGDPRTALA